MIRAIYRGLEDCDDPFFKIGDTYILYESWVGRIEKVIYVRFFKYEQRCRCCGNVKSCLGDKEERTKKYSNMYSFLKDWEVIYDD